MKLRTLRRAAFVAAAAALLATLGAAPAGAAEEWQRVGTDSHSGVSGIAVEGRTDDGGVNALIVHDNKNTGEPRLSRVTLREGSASVSRLTWSGAEPVDLEAVEAVPGKAGEYVALASRGIVYHITVAGSTATVIDYAPLPAIGEGDEFESFAIISQNGTLAALWADRGEGDKRPATLYAASLSFSEWGQPMFGDVVDERYEAEYPTDEGTRHISDITVTASGRILTSSASDAGDDGPFDSAVSAAGRVTVSSKGRVRISVAGSPRVLGTFPQHKIEALECLPGTGDALLGTDDENLGGYVEQAPLCAA